MKLKSVFNFKLIIPVPSYAVRTIKEKKKEKERYSRSVTNLICKEEKNSYKEIIEFPYFKQ